MDPIGNKPIGFYGLSMVYTVSLFLASWDECPGS